jgi:hypothetical protein
MEVTLERLAQNKFKSKMDLRSGFWQVGLTEEAKELAAFMTSRGEYIDPGWLCLDCVTPHHIFRN